MRIDGKRDGSVLEKMIVFKKMRQYSHEEFVELVEGLTEDELLRLSAGYGGYPVLFRMALDERLSHIPFIQTGAAVIVCDESGRILLQKRSDNGLWGLPGGCQDLGEKLEDTAIRELLEETGIKVSEADLVLINTLSGDARKRSYPNGDVVYNNTSLYLTRVNSDEIFLRTDVESSRLEFFSIGDLPEDMHDADMVEEYIRYISRDKNTP